MTEFYRLRESGPLLQELATAVHWDHIARLDEDGLRALRDAFHADLCRTYLGAWDDAAKALHKIADQTGNPIMQQAILRIAAGFATVLSDVKESPGG